jgi:glutamyl-tRNA synthetase
MHKDMLNSEYAKFNAEGWELKHETKEKTLPELSWFKEGMKIITRSAPCPTGAMHFGHARPYILTDEYVKKYGGNYIMRFDDTDPKVKVPEKEMYQEFINDFKWLGINTNGVVNQSDNLERYYEVIQELINMGKVYICFCESEKWKELIWDSKPCPCREKGIEEQNKQWKRMLKHEIKEGEAVARLKTDLTHKDSSTRDWWIAKVVDDPTRHPNKSTHDKHVWPSYNLASAVDDHDMKINFTIRGQEHIANEEKQRILYTYFNWEYPHTEYHGKISKLGDMVLSKSKMKIIMEKEGIIRYDDPRMSTIKAFKRRGILPQTIRKLILACGIGISEVKINMEMIAAFNKELLGEVNEYPYFEEIVPLEVVNMIEGEVEGHGEHQKFKGGIQKFLVNKKELLKNKVGGMVRLKKACNVKLDEVGEFESRATFVSYMKTTNPILSWIIDSVDIQILMNDGTIKRGISTKSILNEKGVIRIEGIGYANIEEKTDSLIKLVFAHE